MVEKKLKCEDCEFFGSSPMYAGGCMKVQPERPFTASEWQQAVINKGTPDWCPLKPVPPIPQEPPNPYQSPNGKSEILEYRAWNNCAAAYRPLLEQAEREKKELEDKLKLTYCVYCGTSFEVDDETGTAVTEHIKTCEKHPLYQANQRIAALESQLKPGSGCAEIFKEIESHALIETLPIGGTYTEGQFTPRTVKLQDMGWYRALKVKALASTEKGETE